MVSGLGSSFLTSSSFFIGCGFSSFTTSFLGSGAFTVTSGSRSTIMISIKASLVSVYFFGSSLKYVSLIKIPIIMQK